MKIQKRGRIREIPTINSFIRRSWIFVFLLFISPFLTNIQAQDSSKMNNNLKRPDTTRNRSKEMKKPVNKQVDTSKTYPYI